MSITFKFEQSINLQLIFAKSYTLKKKKERIKAFLSSLLIVACLAHF
jgi:hypothetical protein